MKFQNISNTNSLQRSFAISHTTIRLSQPVITDLSIAHQSASGRLDLHVLHDFLERALVYAPAFDGAMSNHLPMALHAAWDMGADRQRLEALFEHDAAKQALAATASPAQIESASLAADRQLAASAGICSEAWLIHRGNADAYPWLYHYFTRLLQQQTPAQVIAAHLPSLLRSPHAFAFHGMIRTAHAVEAGHQAELAAALATWAAWWELLPAAYSQSQPAKTVSLETWVSDLKALSKSWRSHLPMIMYRMRSAAETRHYAELSSQLPKVATLAERCQQLKTVARLAYIHSGNSTVLPMITGLRALSILLPFLPAQTEQTELIAALDRASVAAWMAARVDWQAERNPDRLLSWPELRAAALAQDDEHVIKGIHACWYEFSQSAQPDWQVAAQRMLKL